MVKQQLRLFHKQSLEGEEDEHHPARDGNHAWRHLGSEPRPRQHSEQRGNEVPKASPHKNGEHRMRSGEENRGNLGAIAPLRKENHQEDLQHQTVLRLAELRLRGGGQQRGRFLHTIRFSFEGGLDLLLGFGQLAVLAMNQIKRGK